MVVVPPRREPLGGSWVTATLYLISSLHVGERSLMLSALLRASQRYGWRTSTTPLRMPPSRRTANPRRVSRLLPRRDHDEGHWESLRIRRRLVPSLTTGKDLETPGGRKGELVSAPPRADPLRGSSDPQVDRRRGWGSPAGRARNRGVADRPERRAMRGVAGGDGEVPPDRSFPILTSIASPCGGCWSMIEETDTHGTPTSSGSRSTEGRGTEGRLQQERESLTASPLP